IVGKRRYLGANLSAPVGEMAKGTRRIAAVVSPSDQSHDPFSIDAAGDRPCGSRDLMRRVLHQRVDAETYFLDRDAVDLGHLSGADSRDLARERKAVERDVRPTRMSFRTAKVSEVIWNASTAAGDAVRSRRRTSSAQSGGVCERSSQFSVVSFVTAISESTVVRRPARSMRSRHPETVWLRTWDGSRSVSTSLMNASSTGSSGAKLSTRTKRPPGRRLRPISRNAAAESAK